MNLSDVQHFLLSLFSIFEYSLMSHTKDSCWTRIKGDSQNMRNPQHSTQTVNTHVFEYSIYIQNVRES